MLPSHLRNPEYDEKAVEVLSRRQAEMPNIPRINVSNRSLEDAVNDAVDEIYHFLKNRHSFENQIQLLDMVTKTHPVQQ